MAKLITIRLEFPGIEGREAVYNQVIQVADDATEAEIDDRVAAELRRSRSGRRSTRAARPRSPAAGCTRHNEIHPPPTRGERGIGGNDVLPRLRRHAGRLTR